jgi:hypothetical protein
VELVLFDALMIDGSRDSIQPVFSGLLPEALGRSVKRIFAPRENSRLSALIASLVVIAGISKEIGKTLELA